jgi:Ca-activated chloride channel family protein
MTTRFHPPAYLAGGAARDAAAGGQVLRSVAVTGDLRGLLFETSIEQRYVNSGDTNIEAVYTFPLPWRAVILGMEVVIGETVTRAVVAPKAAAAERYEAALENGDTAVMLERCADGMYTVNAGNLLAGEEAIVRFRYAQLLSFEQGQVRIVVPSVIAPRYGSPSSAGLQHHQVPVHDLAAQYALSIRVRLHDEVAEGRLHCPTHPMAIRRNGRCVEVSTSSGAFLDRDWVLVADELEGRPLSAAGMDGENTVVLASFCPAAVGQRPGRPIAMKILVDCSGSMNGNSIDSARRALHEVMKHLGPEDRFTYSRFGDTVFHETQVLSSATAQAIRHASTWIAQTQADMGGTQLRDALESVFVLAQPHDADILLITDGHVWDAERLIRDAGTTGQRIFAVGIGAAPASSLLHELATRTGGACELVTGEAEIHAAIVRMVRRMRQPSARDIVPGWDVPHAWQADPGKAVFSGETVHVFAGFAGEMPGSATICWDEDGTRRSESIAIGAMPAAGSDTLARMAAMARLRGAGDAAQLELAMQYQLVTASTNLLAVRQREEGMQALDMPTLRVVPQMLAAGHGGMGTCDVPAFLRKQPNAAPGAWSGKSPVVWRRESSSQIVKAMIDRQFLHRKQLEEFLQAVDETGHCLATLHEIAPQLPDEVIARLRSIVILGFAEADVIRAFVAALRACEDREPFAQRWQRRLFRWGPEDRLRRLARRVASDVYYKPDPVHGYDVPAFLRRAAD